MEELISHLKKETNYPNLQTYNGFGTALFGKYSSSTISPLEIRMIWFCIFFIPVFPIGTYVVQEKALDEYLFFGKIKFRSLIVLYGSKIVFSFIFSMIISTILRIVRVGLAVLIVWSLYYLYVHFFK